MRVVRAKKRERPWLAVILVRKLANNHKNILDKNSASIRFSSFLGLLTKTNNTNSNTTVAETASKIFGKSIITIPVMSLPYNRAMFYAVSIAC